MILVVLCLRARSSIRNCALTVEGEQKLVTSPPGLPSFWCLILLIWMWGLPKQMCAAIPSGYIGQQFLVCTAVLEALALVVFVLIGTVSFFETANNSSALRPGKAFLHGTCQRYSGPSSSPSPHCLKNFCRSEGHSSEAARNNELLI